MAVFYEQENYNDESWRIRLIIFIFFFLAIFTVLVVRLYILQVKRGDEFSLRGQSNFIQKIRLPADRGFIYDIQGKLLADNRPSLDVYITPAFVPHLQNTIDLLGTILSLSPESKRDITDKLKSLKGLDRFVPHLFSRNINADQLSQLERKKALFQLDGVTIQDALSRRYRFQTNFAHLLGYLNEIGPNEYDAQKKKGGRYKLGDLMGRMGIEREYEHLLKGSDGSKLVVVDAKGRQQRSQLNQRIIGDRPQRVDPKPGLNIVLTVDQELQATAEKAFLARGANEGALIAIDVNTGYVLAMLSLPQYNPNELSSRPDPQRWQTLVNDPFKPLLNRVIQEHYAPGSTYKVVTALAALDREAVRPNEKIKCPGHFSMGRTTWRCWKDRGHGKVDLHDSIMRSCDVYYYNLGARIQLDALAQTAHHLGFGERSGIALGLRKNLNGVRLYDEQPGIVPDKKYRRATVDGFQKGDVINNSIGQGDTNVTPLQLALAYASIANGGTLFTPQVVHRIEDSHGVWIKHFPPHIRRTLDFSPHQLNLIKEGLCSVVNQRGGTAYYRRSRKLKVCGKTGTAQVIRLGKERHDDMVDVEYAQRDHAWFVGFAPADNPQIVVVVVHEHGGHGSSGAAPIVMKTIEKWWDLEQSRTGLTGLDRWITAQKLPTRELQND